MLLRINQLPVTNPTWRRGVIRLAIGVSATIASGLGYHGYQLARHSLLADLERNALLEVENSVREIDNWLGRRKAEIETVANTPTAKALQWSSLQPYLQSEAGRLSDFHLLAWLDAEGRFHTDQGKTGDASDREFFQKAMQGQLFVSDPIVSRSTGVRQVSIAAPIRDEAAKPVGAIAGPIPTDRLTEIVEALSYGPNSYAFALNHAGVPIVTPPAWSESEADDPTSLLDDADPAWRTLAQRMTSNRLGIERLDLDGQPSYVAYFPLEQTNWSIALVLPRYNIESALQPLDALALTIVGLAIAMLITLWRVQAWEQSHLRRAKVDADAAAAELAEALRELRRAQAQLIQSEKMSSLGQLVAGMAHEFNNPVTFIRTNLTHAQNYFDDMVDLLQHYQTHLEPPPAEIAARLEAMDWPFVQADLPHLLTSIRTGSDRIHQLVANLRVFARLDEEGTKAIDLHENLESALTLLAERLQSQPYRREVKIIRDFGGLPLVECYPGALNQVFMQLLTNALDAIDTAARQTGEAAAPAIAIRTKTLSDRRVQIGIADNGIGIPVAIRTRLFDPFFTTKPIGKGTGLGLALAYQAVVAQHGGRLHYKSKPGCGTEFVMILSQHLNPAQSLAKNCPPSHLPC